MRQGLHYNADEVTSQFNFSLISIIKFAVKQTGKLHSKDKAFTFPINQSFVNNEDHFIFKYISIFSMHNIM